MFDLSRVKVRQFRKSYFQLIRDGTDGLIILKLIKNYLKKNKIMTCELFIRSDCSYDFLSCLETFIPEDDSVFRKHVKVAALAVFGYSVEEIAKTANYSEQNVSRVLSDYNEKGFYALLDGRRNYDNGYLVGLFEQTANQLGMPLDQESVRGWFSPATPLLKDTTPQPQLQASTTDSSQLTYSEGDRKLPNWATLIIMGVGGVSLLWWMIIGFLN